MAIGKGFVKGHDFSRAAKVAIGTWALQAAEKLSGRGKKCQGTTSVVPQVEQFERGL
ncbi:MAG: hypothetical protein WBE72_17010 [Terracidiphilus sp.]